MPSTLHVAILRNAALLVPASARAEWLAEWRAELWYVDHNATAFCLGSFRDALCLRIRSFRADRALSLDSPSRCVLLLASLAALTVWPVIASGSLSFSLWSLAGAEEYTQGLLAMYALSSPFLLILNPLTLGSYPTNEYAPSLSVRLRRWLFASLKISLLVPIVCFATIAFATLLPPASFLLYVGLIFGFRWALADQKRRCPVCLHFLSNPVETGRRGHMVFQQHRVELSCARGHGSLYVPVTPTSWCMTQRWQYKSVPPSGTGGG